MHSSRMRTAHSLSASPSIRRRGGGFMPRESGVACVPRGVHACVPGGGHVYLGVCMPGGHTPPPRGQNDRHV